MKLKESNGEIGDLFTGIAHADKYQSGNWISQKLVGNFMKTILLTVGGFQASGGFQVNCHCFFHAA